MIIQKNDHLRKLEIRLRPVKTESQHIQYQLKTLGYSSSFLATNLSIERDSVRKVIYGLRRSRRVECEIARILGKADWNDVVIEARLATQNASYTPTAREIARAKKAELERINSLLNARTEEIKRRLAG